MVEPPHQSATRRQRAAAADTFDRSAPDALALWRDGYLESLASRNYAEGTLEGRHDALKVFFAWAAERDLTRAAQITRPILESYQRWLWRCVKANGQRLGWSTQRNRLSVLKDFFRWLTRQNVILHNPASELELPRMEKRLPQEVLSLAQIEKLLAVPNVTDPLGIRDRAMLELFYSCGIRRTELCRLELADLNTERKTIHVRLGKGKKDRMVPVGERAIVVAGTLLAGRAPASVPGHAHAGVVPHRLRRRLQSRRGVAHGGRVDQAGDGARGIVPPVAAHVRDAHAGKRSRHPVHPAVAWTRKTRHHGHLHRGQHQTTPGGSRPLPPLGKTRKTASTAAAKSVILGRG